MDLSGAVSNPRLQVELPRLAALQARLHALSLLTPKTACSPPRRIGAVIDAITTVLELAEQPMRACDFHTAAEGLLGRPIKWTSAKATLAEHAGGPRPRFQRTSYGRYRIVA
jgi:hypothetical protein